MEEMRGTPPIITDENQVRRHKVEALRAIGIEPWPQAKPVNAQCADILDEWRENEKPSRVYEIAGRIITLRAHGKTVFAKIQDSSGTVQLYLRKDDLGDLLFAQWQDYVDIGDAVWVSGSSFKTKTGEVTLRVASYTLLSKCLHALPDKFHGIASVEFKYRHRYLDLISDAESRERFYKRFKIVRAMRSFFDAYGFVEVETPMLHPIPGGAAARPFVTHHNALDTQLYLRIAPELYLKRLVVGGFERVYEINRNFRNEGISTRHNPEFTMVEFYIAHHDYHYMMDFVEKMLRTIVTEVCDVLCLNFGDTIIDFEKPFARITMEEAVASYCGVSREALQSDRIDELLERYAVTTQNKKADRGTKLYALFEHLVEPTLKNPTFITEFPLAVSPLSKKNQDNPELTDRFELFVAGMELANGFNELNDPDDQAQRFKDQVTARESGDAEAHHYDAEYIQALEYGLPPTVGAGIGIDRLTMLLTNTTSIKDVILFPTLRSEHRD
jgi:lysyl-tRNA synthetase, class II